MVNEYAVLARKYGNGLVEVTVTVEHPIDKLLIEGDQNPPAARIETKAKNVFTISKNLKDRYNNCFNEIMEWVLENTK